MFCPSCGAQSQENQTYCRKCGVNLGIIGKALTLSESIARGDRGPLPKVKEVMQNLKLDHVGEEISRGLEQMNREIVHSFSTGKLNEIRERSKEAVRRHSESGGETSDDRRRRHVVEGTTSLFAGVGMMIAFFYFATAIVLKLPPDVVARIPFEIGPVVEKLWVLGLIPTLKGFGTLLGVLVAGRARQLPAAVPRAEIAAGEPPFTGVVEEPPPYIPSVTEGTTELFENARPRDTSEEPSRS